LITGAEILALQDLKSVQVECPEWGCTVHVREWSAGDRDAWHAAVDKLDNKDTMVHVTVGLAARNEAGDLMFTPEQIPLLKGKNFQVMSRITAACLKLNGLAFASQDEAAKN